MKKMYLKMVLSRGVAGEGGKGAAGGIARRAAK